MPDQPLLEARNLTVRFGAIIAVNDVSVTVNRGEIVGLIGTNGAGKTTFLNMVTGYLRPTSGQIMFDGDSAIGRTPREMVRHGMARSFQIPQLFSELTVLDHVVLAIALAERPRFLLNRIDHRARIDAAHEVLARFGLAQIARRPISLIPQGQRKLIDIAMALALRPKLLLLDEPTSGVSSAEKLGLMDVVFASIRADKTTVLFVEHDMEIVQRYVTRLLAFRDGRLIADGMPADVMRDAQVASAIMRRPPTEQGCKAERAS
ncbi:ABC transporter ATP-binding protein [Bradyrhizobium sp. sBnM-33]|uniref:ABC transporter ATP-binding protein n=1 Tax=Bradyrhizobium sp. sBnM-33 TaxID=2831780 RepID=UPI001BCFFA4B|nr:ATP-binding cassette domain-containing protein [Bradyrhizobium sp. sBnM-33]WOH53390.1 ATP-binding cassette domain-containing protein [Bradyrhizobium sp. sBnM-33]